MRRYSIMYFISQSFKGLWRNGVMTLASITVLMSCLVVMGSFALIVANLNENLESLGDMNEIVAFIDFEKGNVKNETAEDTSEGESSETGAPESEQIPETAAAEAQTEAVADAETESPEALEEPKKDTRSEEERIEELKLEIEAMPNVKAVKYISKQEAFAQEKAKYEKEFPDFFNGIKEDDNVYPASFVITYEDNAGVETLKNTLLGMKDKGIYKINCRADVAETLESLKSGIIWIFVWFLAVLFVVSLFVIINTIKLAVFGRRQEISVMRYVGATNWFIMLPFILEGIIIGILSSGAAFGIQMYIYKFVQKSILGEYNMIKLIPFSDIQIVLLIAFAAIGVLAGIIGSSISLRKNLRA